MRTLIIITKKITGMMAFMMAFMSIGVTITGHLF